MPDWLQEPAAIATLVAAALWLIVRWFRIGKPRGGGAGCSRCDHNVLTPAGSRPGARPTSGVRSSRLRVID